MFSALRRHITPATVLAFVALVFAVTGGAFAATGSGSGSGSGAKVSASVAPAAVVAKAKSKPKAGARGPAGPKGATGATGAAGPAGPTGPSGATGPQGPQGAPGTNGTNGTNGEKGETGAAGPEGSPWTGGGTLPAGKTETGTWSYNASAAGPVVASVSFALPLEEAAAKNLKVHYIGEGASQSPECPGTISSPAAEPGNLCVYQGEAIGVKEVKGGEVEATIFPPDSSFQPRSAGAGESGAGVFFIAQEAGVGWGSYAVTAEG
jgi:Collagen triple helix repeat (20 copies)